MTDDRPTVPTPGRAAIFAVLAAYAAAVCLRAPVLVTSPRFYAEEGSVYFADAATRPWYAAIVAPHLGYFSLTNTLAATAATNAVALEHAPWVTTLVALFIQLLPPLVLLTSGSDVWRPRTSRVAGVLLLLLTPLSGSIWLNTISSQSHLCVAVFLVAIEDPQTGSALRRRAVRALLVLAGLTGPPSCFLAPVFVVRAMKTRGRESIAQASILGVCAVVQGVVFLATSAHGAGTPDRFAGTDPAIVGTVALVNTVALPFCGLANANRLSFAIDGVGAPGTLAFAVLGWGAALAIALVLARRRGVHGRMVACYALVVIPSIVLSAGTGLAASKRDLLAPGFAERYFYAPSVMLALLALTHVADAGWRRIAAGALVASCVTFGALDFRRSIGPYVGDDMPSWRDEVAAWRSDRNRPLRVWPPAFEIRIAR